MSRLTDATRARALANQPKPKADGDDEVEPTPAGPSDDEMVSLIESCLVSSSDSVLAHLIGATHFGDQKDWDGAVQVAQAGLSVITNLAAEIGRPLPKLVTWPGSASVQR